MNETMEARDIPLFMETMNTLPIDLPLRMRERYARAVVAASKGDIRTWRLYTLTEGATYYSQAHSMIWHLQLWKRNEDDALLYRIRTPNGELFAAPLWDRWIDPSLADRINAYSRNLTGTYGFIPRVQPVIARAYGILQEMLSNREIAFEPHFLERDGQTVQDGYATPRLADQFEGADPLLFGEGGAKRPLEARV